MKPINTILTFSFRLSTWVALSGILPSFFMAECFAENLDGIDDVTMQVIRADQLPDDVYEVIPFPRRNANGLSSVSPRANRISKSVNMGNEPLSSSFSTTPDNGSHGKKFLPAGKINKHNGIGAVISLPVLPTTGDHNLILPSSEFPMEQLDQGDPNYDFGLGSEMPPGIDPLTSGVAELPSANPDGTLPTDVNMEVPLDIDPVTGLPVDINQDGNGIIGNPPISDPIAPLDPNGTVP